MTQLPYACATIQQPGTRSGICHGLGQHGPELLHDHPAFAERVDKRVVFLACLLDPQHIVEQQIAAISWCEPRETKIWPVNQNLTQNADFRMNAESVCDDRDPL
jgi:hypothetical protein